MAEKAFEGSALGVARHTASSLVAANSSGSETGRRLVPEPRPPACQKSRTVSALARPAAMRASVPEKSW